MMYTFSPAGVVLGVSGLFRFRHQRCGTAFVGTIGCMDVASQICGDAELRAGGRSRLDAWSAIDVGDAAGRRRSAG